MSDMNTNNPTFVFTWTSFLETLEEWRKKQIEAYPHKSDDINICFLAMQDYMQSEEVFNNKMVLSGDPKTLPIKTLPEEKTKNNKKKPGVK